VNVVFPALRGLLAVGAILTLLAFSVISGRAQNPVFTSASMKGDGAFQLQIQVLPGQYYTVETSTNLVNWVPRANFNSLTNNRITLVDAPPTDNPGRLYYRARLGTALLFHFSFVHFAFGGSWGIVQTFYPVSPYGYAANFAVDYDTGFPTATNVFFTGPPGSGLTNEPALTLNYSMFPLIGATYQSSTPSSPAVATGGTWTVEYKGTNQTFKVADPQATSRLVIPFPTASFLPNGDVRLDWTYHDAITGAELGGPPAFMTQIQAAYDIFVSPNLSPSTTTWTISPGGDPREANIVMTYNDSFGNSYVITFSQLTP